MGIGIYSALSGIQLKEQELELVAHNLANTATTGYKEGRLSFAAVMGEEGAAAGGTADTPFAKVEKVEKVFAQGPFVTTNNPLDVSIQGDGFFVLQTDQGAMYTRDGTFAIDSSGMLVNHRGERVMGRNGTINVGSGGLISISESGVVRVNDEDRGQLQVVDFADKQKLKPMGQASFAATEGIQATPVAHPVIAQGKLEGSNVNVMLNLVKLIEISRQYQTYQKVISQQQQLEQQAATVVGKLA